MFFPFEVADPRSGLHYRLNADRLAELSLAPRAAAWTAGTEIGRNPDPVWAASFENAPGETLAAVNAALEDLVLATPDLRPPVIAALTEGRARRHLAALVGLWQRMGEALPEGLAVVRYVLDLPHGQFLDPLPVVEGSLDPLAPAALRALHDRLQAEFGSVLAKPQSTAAAEGTRLRELQQGLERADVTKAPPDGSLAFYGLRDSEACAAFAAAGARSLIDAGCPANAIAVMTAADPRHLTRAFGDQGVPLSGLPAQPPERDLAGETLLHLLIAKRPTTPAMALASLALSPLMPWSGQTGRDLAETLVGGDFRGGMLATDEAHAALWNDIRMPVSGCPHLRVLLEKIIARLKRPDDLRAALAPLQPLLAGEGAPNWDTLLRAVQVGGPSRSDPSRNLQGVSLWDARESPWRSCRHLIVADFSEGLYPLRPRPNPLFLDSEIAAIEAALGLRLRGRAHGLRRSLALLAEQLGAVSESVTLLVPRRDLAGARLSPAAGLALIARAVEGGDDAGALVVDLADVDPAAWPVKYHARPALAPADPAPAVLDFGGRNLLDLRRDDAGQVKPQSPSRLETLLVSPLAWLLGELDVGDMGWSGEKLDVMAKGNIAHYVFEHAFLPGQPLPDDDTLTERMAEAYETALRRYAGFLRSPSWDMERLGLEREIRTAALRWRDHLRDLGAKILGNEVWLRGQAYGISLHGKADAILRLPDGQIAVVDHKKSSTKKRRLRMQSGWDLQVGLYSDMIARPIRSEGDGMDPLIGQPVGVAYHLMNDGGFLTSGLALAAGGPARDMGNEVNDKALERLKLRIAEVGGGRVALNTTTEAEAFDKLGVPSHALTEGSILVTDNLRKDEQ